MGPAIHATQSTGASVSILASTSTSSQSYKSKLDHDSESKAAEFESKLIEETKNDHPDSSFNADIAKAAFGIAPGYNEGDVSAASYVLARKVVANHRQHVAKKREACKSAAAQKIKEPVLGKHYHYIHGKAYDLRPFYSKHPGGRNILEMTAGLVDSTAVFESYHAMANMPSIMKQLAAYRVTDEEIEEQGLVLPQPMYAFDKDGFWYTLRTRVRAHFGVHKEAASATKASKANSLWWAKFFLFSGAWLVAYLVAITSVLGNFGTPIRAVSALLAGMFFIQWGFNAMHDASHFAVAPRNHWLNEFVTQLWCGLGMWNAKVWSFHHAVLHHSFTGNERLDPDIHHAMPFVRKHPETDSTARMDGILRFLGDKLPGMLGWGLACVIIYVLLPGMFGGQIIFYALYRLAFTKDSARTWGMTPISEIKGYNTPTFEHVLYALQVAAHLYLGNLLVSYCYILSLNFFYSMCIVADHDLLESAVTNHLDVDAPQDIQDPDSKRQDWGECQVRNSTDFVNDPWNLFAHCFGSINKQVSHHAFPGINSVHLPQITPIVQETCAEFGIPYTCLPDLSDAWHSFLLTVRTVMTDQPITDAEMQAYQERIQKASKSVAATLKAATAAASAASKEKPE